MKILMSKPRTLIALTVLFLFGGFAFAANQAAAHEVASEMNVAANLLLQTLDAEQSEAIQFKFDDKLRKDWQFIPMERKGLGMKAMKPHQRGLALALVQTGLSHHGFSTAMQVMALEQVLYEMEDGNKKRDPAKYHLFFFGKPSADATWGWRIEGHHLSVSFTIVDGKEVSVVPAFFGASPGVVKKEGTLSGLRVLAKEEDLGRQLIKNLTVDQKKVAIIPGDAPSDVINGPGREATSFKQAGLYTTDMTDAQKKMLWNLIDIYVSKVRGDLAEIERTKIKEQFDHVNFAWAGKIQPGEPHYYRIEGPGFTLEYDNTQNDANHVHVVWRDLTNDFGADYLKKHYEAVEHAK